MVLRAVVVDELPLICDGIVAALTASRGWLVSDHGTSLSDAVKLVARDQTSMLIFGFCDVERALETIAKVNAKVGPINIVCLIPDGAEASVQRLLRAGVKGCVSRKTNNLELLRCVDMLQDGGNYVSPGLAAHLLCQPTLRVRQPEPKPSHPSLTARELEILQLVAAGESNKAIARHLVLSEKERQEMHDAYHAKNSGSQSSASSIVLGRKCHGRGSIALTRRPRSEYMLLPYFIGRHQPRSRMPWG